MLRLTDRVVMVSGANRGIGLAIARRLHAGGAQLSLGARQVGDLADATAMFGDEGVLRCRYDATERGSDEAWVHETIERFGRLEGLVNNAGVLRSVTLEAGDEAALDEMWEVNVKGPFRLTRAALPHLRAASHGRVVNLSSLSGLRVANDEVGYAMTKFAVTALSHATRRAGWDDGVRVTNVCPGVVDTELARSFAPDLDGEKAVQPEDVAELVATALQLPDTASVAQLTVACRFEASF